MPYKYQKAKFSEAKARGTVHARGLKRSKYVIECSCEIYARKDEEEDKEEKVLNSSH
ncbi:hypothetical protein C1645_829648 [Glomus cerebriforme]|uniref:Uncharacterized protein n=1 Tax=Glomus cerebriforme TaxID=658196 RepID=A0A397SMP4_9GLOM|nr:hypothetical protein C1645_829648 [Glomus cerebriforme]